jgi:hypothetical protein
MSISHAHIITHVGHYSTVVLSLLRFNLKVGDSIMKNFINASVTSFQPLTRVAKLITYRLQLLKEKKEVK